METRPPATGVHPGPANPQAGGGAVRASSWGRRLRLALACALGAGLLVALGVAIYVALPWVNRLGTLQWRSGADWREVSGVEESRRVWTQTSAFLTPEWREVAAGLSAAELDVRRWPNPVTVPIKLLRLAPGWRFRVIHRPDFAPADVETLATEAGVPLAINASFFSEAGPVGLVVSDGERRHQQARRWAAHFVVDRPGGRPRIVNQKRAPLADVDQAFQAFPAIMSQGRTYDYLRVGGRGFDVRAVDRRSAACVTWEGDTVLLVTDSLTNGLAFFELATVLGGLGCRDAMGFDGGSSSSLYVELPELSWRVSGLDIVVGLGAEPGSGGGE